MHRDDRRLGVVLVLVALGWLALVHFFVPALPAAGDPGPRAFPLLFGAALAALGALLALQRAPAPGPPPAVQRPAGGSDLAVAAGTCALLALYAFLLDKTGFLVATPIAVALGMRGLLGIRRWGAIVSVAAAFTLGCWGMFDVLLGTPLPDGSWLTP